MISRYTRNLLDAVILIHHRDVGLKCNLQSIAKCIIRNIEVRRLLVVNHNTVAALGRPLRHHVECSEREVIAGGVSADHSRQYFVLTFRDYTSFGNLQQFRDSDRGHAATACGNERLMIAVKNITGVRSRVGAESVLRLLRQAGNVYGPCRSLRCGRNFHGACPIGRISRGEDHILHADGRIVGQIGIGDRAAQRHRRLGYIRSVGRRNRRRSGTAAQIDLCPTRANENTDIINTSSGRTTRIFNFQRKT